MKKALEEEASGHENTIADMRHKHTQEISTVNEQLENMKKVRGGLEKAKSTLEAENADLATELRNVNQSRQENDRRRKQAEAQIAELQVKKCFIFFILAKFYNFSQIGFIFNPFS